MDDAQAEDEKVRKKIGWLNKNGFEDGEYRWCRGELNGIFGQIAKDIVRTRSELDFFGRRIDGVQEAGCCAGRDPETIDVVTPLFRHDVLARVLLLYARFNPGIQYVQ